MSRWSTRRRPRPRASPGSERVDTPTDDIGTDLFFEGKVARLTTRGRLTGLARPVAVGYVDEPDGSILVAAGDRAEWAINLFADPGVDVEVGDRRFRALAEPLSPADHAATIRALILRYGTPAERLGRGPSFRLRPVAATGTGGSS
ncbi:MAG TPA: nitroreductase family deazaflavin-dependent oxidoreductase [Candidatus Limnocylindrales bacterium]|nr:nitroreductase family deazaflavin-dependent oxidoreductase [Candidatus Limnocylindrales bacterium]